MHGKKSFFKLIMEAKTAEQLNKSLAKRQFKHQLTIAGNSEHVSYIHNGSEAHETFARQLGITPNVHIDELSDVTIGKMAYAGKGRPRHSRAGAHARIPRHLHQSSSGYENAQSLGIPHKDHPDYKKYEADALENFPIKGKKTSSGVKESLMLHALHNRLEKSGFKRVEHNDVEKMNPGEYYIQRGEHGPDIIAKTKEEDGKSHKITSVDAKYRTVQQKTPNIRVSSYFTKNQPMIKNLISRASEIAHGGDMQKTLSRKPETRQETYATLDKQIKERKRKNATGN